MNRRDSKSRAGGITPSFPALRDELIPPVSVKGDAAPATGFPGSFLSGFSCAGWDPKAPALSERGRKFYDTYMASEVWAAKKAPILRRADGRCERCGGTGTILEVHHRNYDRFGGDELESDLEALCPTCHVIADAERRAEVCAAIERRRKEAEKAYDDAGFDGWLCKVKGYDDPRDAGDDLEWLREEYREWCRDRRDRCE